MPNSTSKPVRTDANAIIVRMDQGLAREFISLQKTQTTVTDYVGESCQEAVMFMETYGMSLFKRDFEHTKPEIRRLTVEHLLSNDWASSCGHPVVYPYSTLYVLLTALSIAPYGLKGCPKDLEIKAQSLGWERYKKLINEPARIGAIDLTESESIAKFLSPKSYEVFFSLDASAPEKTRSLRELWLQVPRHKIIVSSLGTGSSVLITKSYLTFPRTEIPLVEKLFAANPTWRPYDLALMLGVCLRHKQLRMQGHEPDCFNQKLKCWAIAQIKTVGGVVNKIDQVYEAKQDELKFLQQGFIERVE